MVEISFEIECPKCGIKGKEFFSFSSNDRDKKNKNIKCSTPLCDGILIIKDKFITEKTKEKCDTRKLDGPKI